MRHDAMLDLIRLVALVLIGAGLYLWLGAIATLIYAGCALLAVVTIVDMRRRVQP